MERCWLLPRQRMSLWSPAKRGLPVMPAPQFLWARRSGFLVQDVSNLGELEWSDATSDSLGLVAPVGCDSCVGLRAELRNPGTACLLRPGIVGAGKCLEAPRGHASGATHGHRGQGSPPRIQY